MEGSSDMYCVVRMIVNYFDQTQNHISRLIYGLDLGKSNDVTCLLEHGMNFPYGELVNDFNYWDKDYPVIEVLQLDYVQCLIPSEMAKQILSPMLPLEITKLVQQYLLRAI
jgi:hypothetical protein